MSFGVDTVKVVPLESGLYLIPEKEPNRIETVCPPPTRNIREKGIRHINRNKGGSVREQ